MAVAMALLLASCANGDDTTEASAGEDGEFRSPIAEYLGEESFGFSPGDEAENEARQIELNEQVQACMAAEGFEWEPNPEEGRFFGGPPIDDEGLEWGSDEWTAKYGLGISTLAFPQDMVGPDLIGTSESFGFEAEHEDPNQEYVEGLSESEQEAYYATLYGDDQGPDIDFEALTQEEIDAAFEEYFADYVPTGCFPEAEQEVFGFGPAGPGYWQEFGDDLEAMYEDIQNDPRIVEAEQATSSCMSDKGLDYTNMETLYMDFDERMRPLYDAVYNQVGPGPGGFDEDELESMTEEELDELFAPQPLSDEQKATLGEIQADEIELAVALLECGGNQEERSQLFQEVAIEYEERFIEENREALDAYRNEQQSEDQDE